jgi:hypothetical protein
MENKNKSVIPFAIIGMLTLVFGFYSSTIQYANAVSVVTVTFAGGTTTFDVAYAKEGIFTSNTDSTAYIIGANGGVAYVWKKSGSGITENTITLNVTLTGSGSARAIEHIADTNAIFAVTNDKIYRLSSSLGISGQLATGTATIIRSLVYDNTQNNLYYCTNDGYGEINTITLSPTTLYSDPQTNSVLGCAIDEANQFMYLSGSDIGASFTCEAIKISLATHTQQDCVNGGASDSVFYSVCFDSSHNEIWVASSSFSRVLNYNSTLDLKATVATSATPRQCSISNSDGANRVYFNIESNDNVSIIDTEADVLISSHLVCNIGVTAPKMDTKRLFNTTNTYVTCPEATNSVLVDNTVSEELPEEDPTSCDNPANANLLRCRLGEDGGIGGIGDSVGEGVLLLGCNVIFVDCTDENPQTNGLGLLAFIASIFVVIGMFYYSIGKDAFHMPIFIYIIIIVALSAFFTITGIIDPVFLVLSIVAIIALASPKIISVVRGSTFGGGSTA